MQPSYILAQFIELGAVLICHGENPGLAAHPDEVYYRDDDGSSANAILEVGMVMVRGWRASLFLRFPLPVFFIVRMWSNR
jgi:hypothetical protein